MNDRNGDAGDLGQLEGRYANVFKIGHNAFEFVFDFGQHYRESETPKLHTRIISAPIYAKALLETLRQSIEQYEQTFGPIPGENGDRTDDAG